MAKITNQKHQVHGQLEADETVALYVNGNKIREYTVTENNKGTVTFMYQEQEIVG